MCNLHFIHVQLVVVYMRTSQLCLNAMRRVCARSLIPLESKNMRQASVNFFPCPAERHVQLKLHACNLRKDTNIAWAATQPNTAGLHMCGCQHASERARSFRLTIALSCGDVPPGWPKLFRYSSAAAMTFKTYGSRNY